MSDDYLWDRSGAPDPGVADLEKLLSPLAHDAPLRDIAPRRKRTAWIIGGVIVAAAAAVAIYLALPGDKAEVPAVASACTKGEGFAFNGVGGKVSCGGDTLDQGTLPVGGTLETGAHQADVVIADIGNARLGPNTKLRLARTDAQQHQLALDVGTMHAKVYAPPRLFTVTTPLSEVVDLGCEYDLVIAPDGTGSVTVQDGLVELATRSGTVVTIPEGCTGQIHGEGRPGLPLCTASSDHVKDAIRNGARDVILDKAERQDAVVLLALAAIDPARRVRAFEKLAELSPPPDVEITAESVLTNAEHLATWQQDVLEIYFGLFGPDAKPAAPATPSTKTGPRKPTSVEKAPPGVKTPSVPKSLDDVSDPFEKPRKSSRKMPATDAP